MGGGAPRGLIHQPASSFVGRERDLEALARLLATHRLVTVSGGPGMGKTRLALRYAELQRQELRAGGVRVVLLAQARSVEDVVAAVARELAVPPAVGSAAARVAAVGAAIRGQGPLLLILDNFEQVVEHAPATVGRWCGLAADARFLVTSREILGVTGETVHELSPLGLPAGCPRRAALMTSEAGRLFVERAGGYRLSDEDAPHVAEILRRLDGVPLAIELAARRVGVLGAAGLLRRLERRFDILTRGARGAEPRQATLEAAIAWSWNLLSPAERNGLAAMSTFRGGFDLEAAEAVLGPPARRGPEAVDVVHALVDKSLVLRDRIGDEVRFRLHESIREFAARRLGARRLAIAARSRHLAHYAGLARAWAEHRRGDATRLAFERDNLAAALRHAVDARPTRVTATQALWLALALGDRPDTCDPAGPLGALLDSALAAGRRFAVAPTLRARALLLRAMVPFRSVSTESLADLEEAVALARRGRDRPLVASVLVDMALHEILLGRSRAARRHFQRALELLRASGDDQRAAQVLWKLGSFHRRELRLDASLAALRKALSLARDLRDVHLEGWVLFGLGSTLLEAGRLDEARAHYQQALTLQERAGSRYREAVTLGNLGIVAQEERRWDEARATYEQALALIREVGERRIEITIRFYLASLDDETGDTARARAGYEAALAACAGQDDWSTRALLHGKLGALEARAGRTEEAAAHLGDGERLAEGGGAIALRAALSLQRGHLLLAEGRAAAVAGHVSEADARRGEVLRLLDSFRAGAKPEAAGTAPTVTSADVRSARRMLQQDLYADALVLSRSERWFAVPGHAGHVSLATRRSLWGMLEALASERAARPCAGLSVEALLAAGWPGERVLPEAGRKRVQVAVATLRSLGLRSYLVSGPPQGYLLDPAVPLLRGERPPG